MPPKVYTVRQAFNAGEVSELVAFRDDVSKYASACLTLENAVPLVEGGAKKMPGSYFAGATALGGSMFTGSITSTTLTVTDVNYGILRAGQSLFGDGIIPGVILMSGASGGAGGGTNVSMPGGDVQVDSSVGTNSLVLSGLPSVTVTGGLANVSVPISISGLFQNPRGSIKASYSYSIDAGITYTEFYSSLNPDQVDTVTNFTITGVTNLASFRLKIAVSATAIGNPPNAIDASCGVITVNCPSGTVTLPYTGTGGTGTYLISTPLTVPSEQMQTASSGKSRLAPFQFSTEQGAILEFSSGVIRVWEGAKQGDWSLGLALQVPDQANFDPATSYVANNVALVGPTYTSCFSPTAGVIDLSKGVLYISSPYGTTNAAGAFLGVAVNSIDTMYVTKAGASPNEGFVIVLANTTPANNAANLIQAAVRALGSLNAGTSNYIDLTKWTVTPDSVYYATPWILSTGNSPLQNSNWIAQCVANNQNDEFPIAIGASGMLAWNAAYWQQFDESTEPPIEVVTPYAESDLFDLDLSTQSADVLWIFHPKYPPAVLERQSANSWVYSLSLPGQQPGESAYRGTLDVVKTGYSALGQSITAITQANPCVVTVAATGNAFVSGSRVYMNEIAGMVELNQGEFIVANPSYGAGTFSFSLQDPNTGSAVDSTGYLKYVSGGFAVQVMPLFAGTGDYPACGTLYQERLCVGGSENNPTQINGSVQDDYPDFICDPNAEDFAIQFTLVSNKLDQILNMIGTPNSLVIGTSGGVWVMTGSNGQSLSQVNVTAAKQTTLGVSNLQPQLVGSSAIFVSRSTRIVQFLIFNFVSNQWDNYDLTRLNRVITLGPTEATSGIAQTAFQMEPYPIYWCARKDGQLIGLVFNQQDKVYAWFRVNMLPGKIESLAVISGKNQEDQLAVVVNRQTNGVTQRFVEYFMPHELFSQISNSFFVNAGQRLQLLPAAQITGINNGTPCVVQSPGHGFSNGMYVNITGVQGMTEINQDATQAYSISGVTTNSYVLDGMDTTSFGVYTGGGTGRQVTNTLTGLGYLIGQQITAIGDSTYIQPPTPVTSDTVTLPYYANLIVVGIPYQMTLRPTNPILSSQGSTTRGMRQKLERMTISLYQAMGGNVGTDLNHMYPINYGPGAMAQQPQMSTIEFTWDLDCDWNDDSQIYITQSDPLPFTVRGLVARMSVNQD